MFVMPRTKQIESRILDLPLPLRPVIELKLSSLRTLALLRRHCRSKGLFVYHPEITVRTAYDLKPYRIGQVAGAVRKDGETER